jgi:hypothetical protein
MSTAFGDQNSPSDYCLNVIFQIWFNHENVVTFTANINVVFDSTTLWLLFYLLLNLFYTSDTEVILERLT